MRTSPNMIALTAVAAFACSATPNPKLTNEPAAWTPPQKSAPSAPQDPQARAAPAPAATSGTPAATSGMPAATSAADASTVLASAAVTTPATARDDAGDGVVAMVGDKPITVRELMAQWVHQNAIEALDQLDHLVLTHLVQEEARRLNVRIDPEVAQQKYSEAVVQIEQKIGEKRPNVSLDQWVDQVLGLDPLVYRTQLREDALSQLLAERVTRAFMLESEHAEMRVIVVKSEEKLKEAQAALAGGEAFTDVAKRLSSDPSAKDGGRVPPVIRSDTVMGKLAFQTKPGEIGGPQYSQGAWLLVKVEALPTPLTGNWPEIAATVEKSLSERHIEELEFTQWKGAMLRRYRVDLSPFLRLAGQPVK
jgi:parvulin-like peptidyl-prolyl isomerase